MIFVTHMETTPNPNALKYVLNETILADGICQYSTLEEADDDMGRAIFAAPGVLSLFYRDNYITVTKNNDVDWIDIETLVKDEINNRVEAIEFKAQAVPEINFGDKQALVFEIDDILDETIRPGLAMDGGGVDIIDLSDEMVLTVRYQGACGSCPSSTTGTLMAIENILQEQFDPRITVQTSTHMY
jgi:NFU1 iron-sulfur cluster scaffold homolog, mitochondrial